MSETELKILKYEVIELIIQCENLELLESIKKLLQEDLNSENQ